MQLQYVSNGLQSAVVVIKDKKVIFIKIQALVQDQLLQFTMLLIVFLKRIVNSSIIELIQLLKVQMQAEVHVELVIENQHVNGIGIDHDILQASCKAYVEAHAKYIAQDLESR